MSRQAEHTEKKAVKSPELSVVTGALGYTGRYIAGRLLSEGGRVKTLTGHPDRPNPFGDRLEVASLQFDDAGRLAHDLEGASTLYNTYWIRFAWREVTFEKAVENTRVLIRAAEDAGVRRIVHISISNASSDSPLPYFRGKGLAEEAVSASRMSHAIIRPTEVFGVEDVLINNIVWALRRFPVFPIFGAGDYRLQPVYVEDLAEIAVRAGREESDRVIDAFGPETYTYEGLVRLLAREAGSRARLVHVPPALALVLTRLVGYVMRDVVLTPDEIEGLMAGLLAVDEGPTTASTRFSEWLKQNAALLGHRYVSALDRHYRKGTGVRG